LTAQKMVVPRMATTDNTSAINRNCWARTRRRRGLGGACGGAGGRCRAATAANCRSEGGAVPGAGRATGTRTWGRPERGSFRFIKIGGHKNGAGTRTGDAGCVVTRTIARYQDLTPVVGQRDRFPGSHLGRGFRSVQDRRPG
jgi:hypothetical protein